MPSELVSCMYRGMLTNWCTLPRSPHIDLKAKENVEFAKNLKEHSVLYRVLQYVLV
jgi:hypothetical protein